MKKKVYLKDTRNLRDIITAETDRMLKVISCMR